VLVIWPVFEMMRLVSDRVSGPIAIVFFAANCAAFIYSRQRRSPASCVSPETAIGHVPCLTKGCRNLIVGAIVVQRRISNHLHA
jgi:hypothetical protein